MKSSVFVIEISNGESRVIAYYGHNNDYRIKEDSLDVSLKEGKVTHQTQSEPDSEGRIYVTISVEKG